MCPRLGLQALPMHAHRSDDDDPIKFFVVQELNKSRLLSCFEIERLATVVKNFLGGADPQTCSRKLIAARCWTTTWTSTTKNGLT